MRFQRGVIYVWRQPQPWTDGDRVSIANAGDFVKEASGIPARALEPESPHPARDMRLATRGGQRDEGRVSGVATWYGSGFHGVTMANGERFNMWDQGIAASNTHPIGARLRVTRVETGDSIVVRVVDRGAFRAPIVVDLSYAAFTRLADSRTGVIPVVVDPLD
jgi:rare lipoprotein A